MKSIVAGMLLVAVAGVAMAETPGLYLYGTAGKTFGKLDQGQADTSAARALGGSTVTSSTGSNPAAFRLQAGYDLGEVVSIEAGYMATRDYSYNVSAPVSAHASEKIDAWNIVAAAKIPVANGFSALTRLGVASVHAKGSGSVVAFGGRKTGLTGGVGVQYDIDKNLFVNMSWDNYTAPSDAKLGNIVLWNLGLGYKF